MTILDRILADKEWVQFHDFFQTLDARRQILLGVWSIKKGINCASVS